MPDRVLPVLRSPLERVHDWNEFHTHPPETTLREQGAPLYGLRRSILSYR